MNSPASIEFSNIVSVNNPEAVQESVTKGEKGTLSSSSNKKAKIIVPTIA